MEEVVIKNISDNQMTFSDLINAVKDYYLYLKSKWKILFFIPFFGAVLGLSISYLSKPKYYSYLTYALEDEKSSASLGGALGIASSLGIDLGTSVGGAFGSANLMELMHSRNLIEKTLLSEVSLNKKTILLANYFLEVEGYYKKWKGNSQLQKELFKVGQKRESFTRLQDSIMYLISSKIDKEQLSIYQKDKKISIGTIQVVSTNEIFAKSFTEKLVEVVSTFYIEAKSKKAKLNVSILQKQTDSIRNELNNAINGVAIANDATYNLNPALNIKRTPSARRQVDVQANTAILTQLVANLELAKVTLRKETPLIQVIDSPIYPLKKEKIGKLVSIISGFFLCFFLCCIYFIVRKLLGNIIKF